MVNMSNRGFAGGGKMKPIDPATTDFDLVCVGGINAVALTKHIQQHHDAKHLKIAIVAKENEAIYG